MKVALCFFGQPRKVEICFRFFKSLILDVYNPDVFYHTWFMPDESDFTKSFWRESSDCKFVKDPKIIRELYKPKLFLVEPSKKFYVCEYSKGYLKSHKERIQNADATCSQHYSRRAVRNLLLSYSQTTGIIYDVVIMARFDLFITKFKVADMSKIYFSGKFKNPDFPDYYDWIIASNHENFLKIFDIDTNDMLHKGSTSLNPEEFIVRKIFEHKLEDKCDLNHILACISYRKIFLYGEDDSLARNFNYLLTKLGFIVFWKKEFEVLKVGDSYDEIHVLLSTFISYVHPCIKYIYLNFQSVDNPVYPYLLKEFLAVTKNVHVIDGSFQGRKKEEQRSIYPTEISRHVVPYGFSAYHEYRYKEILENFPNLGLEQDLDILFYGKIEDSRIAEIYNKLYPRWKEKKYSQLFISDKIDEIYKTALIYRAKIILSISTSYEAEFKTNDLLKLSYLICNRKFCIVEERGDFEVENLLKKYLEFWPSNNFEILQEKIDFWLSSKKREEKCNTAYEGFKKDFDMETGLADVMDYVLKIQLEEQDFS